eukprot:TRINITY_DN6649_c0_g1_i2.p1 TRINITY_DN6649_c0_g1~~TRINITY_DN6649_c0_g1_i2.p1  ORF type:complete len:572 (+),score=176.60 TRINITY_DN6649_c0_g1_i2:93-1718(+)
MPLGGREGTPGADPLSARRAAALRAAAAELQELRDECAAYRSAAESAQAEAAAAEARGRQLREYHTMAAAAAAHELRAARLAAAHAESESGPMRAELERLQARLREESAARAAAEEGLQETLCHAEEQRRELEQLRGRAGPDSPRQQHAAAAPQQPSVRSPRGRGLAVATAVSAERSVRVATEAEECALRCALGAAFREGLSAQRQRLAEQRAVAAAGRARRDAAETVERKAQQLEERAESSAARGRQLARRLSASLQTGDQMAVLLHDAERRLALAEQLLAYRVAEGAVLEGAAAAASDPASGSPHPTPSAERSPAPPPPAVPHWLWVPAPAPAPAPSRRQRRPKPQDAQRGHSGPPVAGRGRAASAGRMADSRAVCPGRSSSPPLQLPPQECGAQSARTRTGLWTTPGEHAPQPPWSPTSSRQCAPQPLPIEACSAAALRRQYETQLSREREAVTRAVAARTRRLLCMLRGADPDEVVGTAPPEPAEGGRVSVKITVVWGDGRRTTAAAAPPPRPASAPPSTRVDSGSPMRSSSPRGSR